MIRFESNKKGTWFYLDEDNHDAGRICLRELTLDEIEEIDKKTVRREMKVIHGIAYNDEKTDEKNDNLSVTQPQTIDLTQDVTIKQNVQAPCDQGSKCCRVTQGECSPSSST